MRSSSSSSSRLSGPDSRARLCACGIPVVMYTSHSPENPNRRFWRCKHWKSEMDCKYFKWVDEDGTEGEIARLELELFKKDYEIEEMKKKMEDVKKKVTKLQKRVEDERFYKNLCIVVAVLLCVLTIWVMGYPPKGDGVITSDM